MGKYASLFFPAQVPHPGSPHHRVIQEPPRAGLHPEARGGGSHAPGTSDRAELRAAPTGVLLAPAVSGAGSGEPSLGLWWERGWGSIYSSSDTKEGAPCFAGRQEMSALLLFIVEMILLCFCDPKSLAFPFLASSLGMVFLSLQPWLPDASFPSTHGGLPVSQMLA